jgi:hypothetical protein
MSNKHVNTSAYDKIHTLCNNVHILRTIYIILKKCYTLTKSLNCFQSDIQRTRCCVYTIDPPDDGHNMARNMLRNMKKYNKQGVH